MRSASAKRATSKRFSDSTIPARRKPSRCSSSQAAQDGVSKKTASGFAPRLRRSYGGLRKKGSSCSCSPAGYPVEHRLEAVRRVVAVQPRHDPAALVEKDERRRELDFQEGRELFLGEFLSVRPGYLAVAPDVERNREEILSRLVGDRFLAEVGQDQFLAVGAVVLLEEDHEPLALARGLAHVLPEIEESLGEPRRQCDRPGGGARRGTRKEEKAKEQRGQLHRRAPQPVSRGT